METLESVVKGIFIGALTYAVSFYCFLVLGMYALENKLDFSGEWGGFIIGAVIAFIIGGIVGCIISLIQPTSKSTLIASSVIGILLVFLLAFSSSSSSDPVFDVISSIIFILIIVFNNWLIVKVTSVKNEKNAVLQ